MSLLFCFWEEEFFSSSDTRLNSRGNGAFHGIHDDKEFNDQASRYRNSLYRWFIKVGEGCERFL